MRVHELAKELGMRNNELLNVLKSLGYEVTNHMSVVDETQARRVKAHLSGEEPAPQGVVTEKRIDRPVAGKSVVIRRRSRKQEEAPEAAEKKEAAEAPAEQKPTVVIRRRPAAGAEAPAPEQKPAEVEAPAAASTEVEQPAAAAEPEQPKAPAVEAQPAEVPVKEEQPAAAEAQPEQPVAEETPAAVEKPAPVAEPAAAEAAQPQQAAAPRPGSKITFEQARILDKPRIPLDQLRTSAAVPQTTPRDGEEEDRRAGGPGARKGKTKAGGLRRRVVTKRDFKGGGFGDDEFDVIRGGGRKRKGDRRRREAMKTEITTPKAIKRKIRISDAITVGDLAHNMGVKAGELTKRLMELGVMATINQGIDVDTAAIIAAEYGYEIENVSFQVEDVLEAQQEPADPTKLAVRSPVVTVMGHVDHGKTSLLDAIRSADVASGEAGGITQHIGAYQAHTEKGVVTFIDTPGHEAFTAMRARGAQVTDIAIIVVAANDGVMPQTIEAISHAKEAGVPIIVAVNKVDLPEANPDKVKQQLTEYGLVPEEWGGETIFENVSAKARTGISNLLDSILLQAEVLELRADATKLATGVVIESRLDKGRGPVATLLVQDGNMQVGSYVVAGKSYGRVRAMLDDHGKQIPEAGPSLPIEVLGLSEVPPAGERFHVVKDEKTAKQVAEHRAMKEREIEMARTSKVSLEDLYKQIKEGETQELRLIIKADVQGSIEALKDSFVKLSTDEVKVRIIHTGVGAVSESDVMLASASNAVVICFNTRPDGKSTRLAEQEGVDLEAFTIIYEAVDAIRKAMEGMLAPEEREVVLGRAEVRQTFVVTRSGTIAGCMVTDGKVTRTGQARLLRDGTIVYTGKIGSLRRVKDDVREVQSGFECGISLDGYNDIKVGDVIEVFEVEQVARSLGGGGTAAAR